MQVELQPFEIEDADELICWSGSPRFLLQWAGPRLKYPLDREQLEDIVQASTGADPKILPFKAIDKATGETVGHIELFDIDRENGTAILGRALIGREEYRGQGIGTEMVRSILTVAFDGTHLHRVALHVFCFNEGAVRCYERAGFSIEGRMREARRFEKEYWDFYTMSILEDEWRNT